MTDQPDLLQAQTLLVQYRRSLTFYLEQLAIQSPAFATPVLLHNIADAREHIRRIKNYLRTAGATVDDYLIDEAAPAAGTDPAGSNPAGQQPALEVTGRAEAGEVSERARVKGVAARGKLPRAGRIHGEAQAGAASGESQVIGVDLGNSETSDRPLQD